MNVGNGDEVLAIMEYIKSANLKGSVEIGNNEFLWDLGGVFLRFAIDVRETTVFYLHRKSQLLNIGHFHEDNFNVISLINEINSEDKRVQITVHPLGDSFSIINKTDKKKRSWLIVRYYYSQL